MVALADTKPNRLDAEKATARPTTATKAADVVSGELIDGRYRIEERLGEGGMGAVFRAYDVESDRRFAIKILGAEHACDTEFVERFNREARTTGALDHPAVVKVHAVGRHGARRYLVMDLLEGETLEGRLDRGRMSLDEVLAVLHKLGAGLSYLHREKLVHRDVKPGNVMLGKDGAVTLLDFGLVRGHRDPALTRDGFAVGTPGAMSPEQILCDRPVDGRADQYALGVLAFEMLSGKMPFSGMTDVQLLRAHIESPVPDPRQFAPEMPAAVAAVVMRAMAKKPEERFADIDSFLAALDAALGVKPNARPSTPRWLAAVLGVVGVLGGIAIGFSMAHPAMVEVAALCAR